MSTLLRRSILFVASAAVTAAGLLFWLHDGNVKAALAEGRTGVSWDVRALQKAR